MSKSQALEHQKPTKKMLKEPINHGNLFTKIGQLTMEQLQVAMYRAIHRQRAMEQGIVKAINTLENTYP